MPFGTKRKGTRPPLTEPELFEYAVKSLGARMQSRRDLQRKLVTRAEPGSEGQQHIAAVLAKLEEMRYLSDERFASDFTRLRQENRSLGRRRVQQDLQNKGIASALISETLDAAYNDLDEAALVRQHLQRRRIPPPTDDKSTARVLRRLTAAGFSSRSIFKVLRELRGSTDTLDVAEQAVED